MVFVDALLALNRNFFYFWGYLFVFLGIFIDSLPFIGAFIPGGTIILLLAGFLTKFGFFVLWKVLVVAIIASISVDIFSYFVGRAVKKDFLHWSVSFFFIKKSVMEKVCMYVRSNPGKALIFGRLNPVTRAIAPFMVGMEKINFGKFLFYNVIGGILWATMFIFIGYLFGETLRGVEHIERYIAMIAVTLVAGFYAYYIYDTLRNGEKTGMKQNGANCKK